MTIEDNKSNKVKMLNLDKVESKRNKKGIYGPHENYRTMTAESSSIHPGSSQRYPLDYTQLDIPESRILESIFLRDGMFDFTIYPYPDDVDVNMLDFCRAGATVDIK